MGILVLCNREIGIVMYNNSCYGFSNQDVMDSFRKQPAKYVASVIDCMIKIPQLIFTLQMEEKFDFPVIADISNKKTHSTQTDLSHFRRENYSQVYLPKDQYTQTKKDGSTNITRAGLPELFVRTRKTFFEWS
ncbi:cilia-and flagella-associated protein [Trichonephila inaurata madagascariensis]|uniref:Cilia- and flagella-associated protein 206 n=1 Tax=Trichonephila inaurata madagascariensis TaxID=2747483 RepID=A0A8X6X1K0_9ARAC|nr:cilia-and flagella-associated protein [Trichonephila inaurata madagascariensis]